MKTTVQALKELYATLGGNLADVALIERIPEMIEALNSIAVAVPAPTAEDEGKVMTVGEDGELGFANALPPVTSGDAGKVLTVDEQGAWNPAEASGGGNFVLKELGEVSYSVAPHDVGWKKQEVSYTRFTLPDDFAFLGPIDFPGRNGNSAPLVYAPISQTANQYGINIKGTLHTYYESENPGIASGVVTFYYYAKA